MQYPEKSRGEATATNLAPVTLFKPRQVLLNSYSNMNQPSDQSRLILLQSICQFLERNGFPKTLKKFFKEAHIEKESWKNSVPNLEEMCFQHIKKWNDAKVSDNAGKEQATNTKDKVNDGKKSQTKVENPLVDGFDDVKANKKKKSKSENNKDEDVLLSVSNEHQKKSKDKKHKDESHEKKEEMSDLSEVETLEKVDDVSKKDKKEKSKSKKKKEAIVVENTNDDVGKKLSKKRKKPASEEDETGGVEKEVFDDSKRRKKDNIDQSNGSKTPDGSVNGVLENDKKESWSKDKTKLSNGSSEPRSAANAFRRVKEEEVEFVDERLQDNSYWAKDGAESGYGAKAQEVLGQVRGKGFRHEKTKKKRGSYRGGQIDLESHSIKFNYDEDE
ncbi:uncharacterized protein LOC130824451 [Amaranthus tricolor]|uniref:uncharacterized protein LOC130824451 n=1 Tax=Amaranthus tricolor TaxID=29722 RepID=UPI00258BFBE1|nr:uncharacterized protein LOC130824451 [Amaranthus tricolor]